MKRDVQSAEIWYTTYIQFSREGLEVTMNHYETIQQLEKENAILKAENQKLSETVAWMHDYIWTLVKKRFSNS